MLIKNVQLQKKHDSKIMLVKFNLKISLRIKYIIVWFKLPSKVAGRPIGIISTSCHCFYYSMHQTGNVLTYFSIKPQLRCKNIKQSALSTLKSFKFKFRYCNYLN